MEELCGLALILDIVEHSSCFCSSVAAGVTQKALVFLLFIQGSFWRRELAWVVREHHFNLRELSKSHKMSLCYPLQYLNKLYSEFKLLPYEVTHTELPLQSSVYFRFVHK